MLFKSADPQYCGACSQHDYLRPVLWKSVPVQRTTLNWPKSPVGTFVPCGALVLRVLVNQERGDARWLSRWK